MKQRTLWQRYMAGMTLIELMVSITIGVFLMLVLGAMFLSFKQTAQTQNGIAQLQDDQRMSITLLSQVIQSAGYYGSPASYTATTAFPADSTTVSGISFSAGQVIYGVDSGASTVPDTLYVRYQSVQNDGVVNCLGGTNASSTTAVYINQLSASANSLQLTCSLNGAAAVGLVGGINASGTVTTSTPCTSIGYMGISNIQYMYGYDASGSGSVTQYVTAGSVSNWTYVYSVQATITQLYCSQQGTVPQAINFSRVIFLPNQQ